LQAGKRIMLLQEALQVHTNACKHVYGTMHQLQAVASHLTVPQEPRIPELHHACKSIVLLQASSRSLLLQEVLHVHIKASKR
jgi:hypothetical protein